MLKVSVKSFILAFMCVITTGLAMAQVSLQSNQFKMELGSDGHITGLSSIKGKKNYLPAGERAPLLSLKIDGKILQPQSLQWRARSGELLLTYPEKNIKATLAVQQNADYITMELKQLTRSNDVEWVLWGPFPTTIADTIGEVIGVVRSSEFAIGIQALNIKTLGGHPAIESDIQPAYDVFADGNKVDVGKDDLDKQLFRGETAKPMPYGSLLQAYCRNRNRDKVIDNWSHPNYLAPAYKKDGGVIGSRLAIFGVATPDVLSTISRIELKEGLPHPLLDGVWGKQARHASESYFIMNFGVNNIKDALSVTRQAGLRYLYHGGPFETWGHFKLNSREFPDNWTSLRSCVDIARTQNMRLGLHTLSNFITTNDPYVTPIPDKRLAKVGYSLLTENISAVSKEIGIKDPIFFNQYENNTLKAVVVGNEIIRYETVSQQAPWKLLNCQRGAFNTRATDHQANDSIGKLMDHGYQVFLGDHALDQEIAGTIARLYNETGLMQISFDGLEGCWSEGMGDYGKQLFTKTWFDQLKPELKGKVINDASNPGHYFWHIYTRMNWGEPWYAGFRESHLQLRLKNQMFYRRNLMPSMLGWFSLKSETTLEDIEWMLARGAGFDAGFGLSTSMETMKNHGRKDEILAAIKTWEDARQQDLFTPEQKKEMMDTRNEFHLQQESNGAYKLVRVHNAHFIHEQKIKQPGEPVFSSYEFNNPADNQPMAFIMSMAPKKEDDPGVAFENISIAVNQQDRLVLPVSLKRNEIIYCDGKSIRIYNRQWQLLQTLPPTTLPLITGGRNQVVFDGNFSGENGSDIKLEIRANGKIETLKGQNK